jgi:hypothetical protein
VRSFDQERKHFLPSAPERQITGTLLTEFYFKLNGGNGRDPPSCQQQQAGLRPERPLDTKVLSDSSSSRCRHSDPVGEKIVA